MTTDQGQINMLDALERVERGNSDWYEEAKSQLSVAWPFQRGQIITSDQIAQWLYDRIGRPREGRVMGPVTKYCVNNEYMKWHSITRAPNPSHNKGINRTYEVL